MPVKFVKCALAQLVRSKFILPARWPAGVTPIMSSVKLTRGLDLLVPSKESGNVVYRDYSPLFPAQNQ